MQKSLPKTAGTTYEAIFATVCLIPPGKVASYGRIAALAGLGGQARLVGYALHSLRAGKLGDEVPWWRVINAKGYISNAYEPDLQQALLAQEGVTFTAKGQIDLTLFLWDGA